MGMSASQARLLFITSRIHDIEMKSQNIANQKIRLASDSEQVSANYVKALNKTNLMLTDPLTQTQSQLSYTSIMSPDRKLTSYSLRDVKDRVVVPKNIEAAYYAASSLESFLDNVQGALTSTSSSSSSSRPGPVIKRAAVKPSILQDVEGNTIVGNITGKVIDTGSVGKIDGSIGKIFTTEGTSSASGAGGSGGVGTTEGTSSVSGGGGTGGVNGVGTTEGTSSVSGGGGTGGVNGVGTTEGTSSVSGGGGVSGVSTTEGTSSVSGAGGVSSGLSVGNVRADLEIASSNISDATAINRLLNDSYVSSLIDTANSLYSDAMVSVEYAEGLIQSLNSAGSSSGSSAGGRIRRAKAAGSSGSDSTADAQAAISQAQTDVANAKRAAAAALRAAQAANGVTVGDRNKLTSSQTDYYTDLYNQMQNSGCVGYDQKLLNSNDALANMLQSGEWFLSQVDANGVYNKTSLATNTLISEVSDKVDIAKAEAEYNAESQKINNKEKILDNELKKLDTEHSALNTEFDSVQNLIKNNTEKSFNLFS